MDQSQALLYDIPSLCLELFAGLSKQYVGKRIRHKKLSVMQPRLALALWIEALSALLLCWGGA